jgi:hypothetical protein
VRLRQFKASLGVLALLASAFALSMGLPGHWAAGARDAFVVNDDTTPTDDGCGAPDFQTEDIQNAIDSSLVADGDTLIICEGTYNAPDAIEVSKSLAIEGRAAASRDDIVVQVRSGAVQVSSESHGFTVRANDVKIRHMKLVGPGTTGPPGIDFDDHGIHLESPGPTNYDNAQFSDLEITNWDCGVYIYQSNESVVGPANHIHGNSSGVRIEGGFLGGRRDRVIDNVIGPNDAQGITLGQTDETYIERNTLAGNYSQITWGASTVFIWNNEIDAASGYGLRSDWAPADNLVQIGGTPEHANNFTGTLLGGFVYIYLTCDAEATFDATYNYWNGINSREAISAAVFNDEYDDPLSPGADCPRGDASAVVVHPWLISKWTPTPTPTAVGSPIPSTTRAVDLSPPGWHDLAWSGADGTGPADALACVSGKYGIAYAWQGPDAGFTRYVEGCPVPGICTMGLLDKYDSLFLLITSEGATCEMPVAPEPAAEPADETTPPDIEPPPPATLVTAAGDQTSGVYNYCWSGLCVDMLGVLVPTHALVARIDEPLGFELAIAPTQVELVVWPFGAGAVVAGYDGFLAWRPQSEQILTYEVPAQSSLQFTPDLAPGRYVIVLAVRAAEGDVGYAFQVELAP